MDHANVVVKHHSWNRVRDSSEFMFAKVTAEGTFLFAAYVDDFIASGPLGPLRTELEKIRGKLVDVTFTKDKLDLALVLATDHRTKRKMIIVDVVKEGSMGYGLLEPQDELVAIGGRRRGDPQGRRQRAVRVETKTLSDHWE